MGVNGFSRFGIGAYDFQNMITGHYALISDPWEDSDPPALQLNPPLDSKGKRKGKDILLDLAKHKPYELCHMLRSCPYCCP